MNRISHKQAGIMVVIGHFLWIMGLALGIWLLLNPFVPYPFAPLVRSGVLPGLGELLHGNWKAIAYGFVLLVSGVMFVVGTIVGALGNSIWLDYYRYPERFRPIRPHE